MRLEQRKLVFLIERNLLEIQTRRVDMCGRETDAVLQRIGADDRRDDRLAAVAGVDLVACPDRIAALPFPEALCFEQSRSRSRALALGLALVEELLVALAECIALCDLLLAEQQTCIFLLHQQRFPKLFQLIL